MFSQSIFYLSIIILLSLTPPQPHPQTLSHLSQPTNLMHLENRQSAQIPSLARSTVAPSSGCRKGQLYWRARGHGEEGGESPYTSGSGSI
ncbi:hypothetical protein FGO68_gene10646 [Halteria grandinella]|uniref:Secreted protein n=1 Tax=Halteria grandinella TaxID=5974 RepID=A0A8J8NXG5_HALGN|nr:hypothetical protein FGO68_gene10646 [Halteria grandinella]